MAPGSTALIAARDPFSRRAYSGAQAFGDRPSVFHHTLRCGSFQICHLRSGRFGSSGCSAQNEPAGP